MSVNDFDNYKLGAKYILNDDIVQVVGYSECGKMERARIKGVEISSECRGCKGYSHFKYESGTIHTACAHNGSSIVVRTGKEIFSTNIRW